MNLRDNPMSEEPYSNNDDSEEGPPRSCLGILFLLFFLACILLLFGLSGTALVSSNGNGESGNTSGQTGSIDGQSNAQTEAGAPQTEPSETHPSHAFFKNAPENIGMPPTDDLQGAKLCGAEMNYPNLVNDYWDVWDLSYYVTQQTEQGNPLSQGCQQLAYQNSEGDLGAFMSSIGADWWNQSNSRTSECGNISECADTCSAMVGYTYSSVYDLNANLTEEYPSADSRPDICIQFQDSLLSEDIANRPSNNSNDSCEAGKLPSAICKQKNHSSTQACATALNLPKDINTEELYKQVRDRFAIQLGELENSCVSFLQDYLAEFPPTSNTETQMERAASCLNMPETCTGLKASDLEPYHDEIRVCASQLGWRLLEKPEDELAFVEHLVISAPWKSQNQWDESCVNLLESLSKDAGGYWELLGRVLASKRGN